MSNPKVMRTWAGVMHDKLAYAAAYASQAPDSPDVCRQIARALCEAATLLDDIAREHQADAAQAIDDAETVREMTT